MIVEYLDLETGKRAKDSGISEWELIEGNWSCDCNRPRAFGETDFVDHCVGFKRYIVINVELEDGETFQIEDCTSNVIAAANRDYYSQLRKSKSNHTEWYESLVRSIEAQRLLVLDLRWFRKKFKEEHGFNATRIAMNQLYFDVLFPNKPLEEKLLWYKIVIDNSVVRWELRK